MGYSITRKSSTGADAEQPDNTSAQNSPPPPSEADSVQDDVILSYSTGAPYICERSACDSSARIHLWPDIDCRDDIDTLEQALRDVQIAVRLYESSEAVLSTTLSPQEKNKLFSVLEKQADMLIYSINRSKPYSRSHPFHFSRPMPFDDERYWLSDGSNQADLYDAITMTKSDQTTQKAILDSYLILRNMFLPSSGRVDIESLLKEDVELLDRACADHLRTASYIDRTWEERAQDKKRWAESFTGEELMRREKDAMEAEYQRACATDVERLRTKAKGALQALADGQGGEEVK